MSKLGFDRVIKSLPAAKRSFLKQGLFAARKEFKRNFDTESNAESGTNWDMVLRGYPPPILDVRGELRAQAIQGGNVTITLNSITLEIDPLDERGRGYAEYHQEGTDVMAQRAFVTQSKQLTKEQEILLNKNFDPIW